MTLDYTLIGVLKSLDTLGILHRYDGLIHAIMTPGVIDNLPNYQTRARALFYGRLTGKNPCVRDSAPRENMRPNPIFFVPGRRIRRPRDPCKYCAEKNADDKMLYSRWRG